MPSAYIFRLILNPCFQRVDGFFARPSSGVQNLAIAYAHSVSWGKVRPGIGDDFLKSFGRLTIFRINFENTIEEVMRILGLSVLQTDVAYSQQGFYIFRTIFKNDRYSA